MRQVGDDLAHVPDQLAEVGLLPELAVDEQLDEAAVEDDAGHRRDLGDDRGVLEILAEVPGPTFLARCELQVAPRQVEAAGVAVDEVVRAIGRDAKTGSADRHDQLHLVMAVLRLRRIRDGRAGFDERLRGLGEVERPVPFLLDLVAHLGGVGEIVAADAEDPVDRHALGEILDRQRNRLGRRPEEG